MKTVLKGKALSRLFYCFQVIFPSPFFFFFLISIFSFLFYIFQIQITDIIKVTTQKQGGLANNSRAIAVVRILLIRHLNSLVKSSWFAEGPQYLSMPSHAFPCRLSCIRGIFRYVDKIRCTFVQVFASCRRYELNITGQNCSFIFVRDVIHVWRSSSRFCWQKSNNICRDRYR